MDLVTLALAKKYVADSLAGAGAVKGEKGDTGATGQNGADGKDGANGKDGVSPTVVSTGSTASGESAGTITDASGNVITVYNGAKGPQGEQGIQGQQGEQGIQGQQGVQGIKGDKGDTGDKGADGADGKSFTIKAQYATEDALLEAHPTGEAGDAYLVTVDGAVHTFVWLADEKKYSDAGAIQGVKGDKGDKGDKGEQGEAGTQGVQGIQGIQGVAGEKGATGDKGDKGDKGDDGFSPTIETAEVDGGTKLTITDKDGAKEVTVLNGKDGEKGADADPTTLIDDTTASASKTYSSNKIRQLTRKITTASVTDLNSLTESGVYSVHKPTNAPYEDIDWINVIVMRIDNNAKYIHQIGFVINQNNIYSRAYTGNEWTSWKSISFNE